MNAKLGAPGAWVLHLVCGLALVEALSSHLIGGDCFSPQAESQRLSYLAPLVRSRSSASLFMLAGAPSMIHLQRRTALFSRQSLGEGDEGFDDISSPKFREKSEEEISLRNMVKNTRREPLRKARQDRGNNYANNYARNDRSNYIAVRNGDLAGDDLLSGRIESYGNSFDENVDYSDDYEDEPTAGNFWSNPISSVDYPSNGIAQRGVKQQQQLRYGRSDNSDDSRQRRRRRPRQQDGQRAVRRRSPAPSGLGQPPQIFKDFYDQLFWYGFDVDESAEVGDNTVFGGTKGKFNGFNYLLAEQNDDNDQRPRPSRRIPPSRIGSDQMRQGYNIRNQEEEENDSYWIDNYDDNDRADDEDYYEVKDSKTEDKLASSSLYTPPTDQTSTRYDYIDDYDDYKSDDDDYSGSQRRIRTNLARYDGEAEYMDRRSGGRRRRRQQSRPVADWLPLGMIESFLGIDREEMDYKANVYNSKMGLGKGRQSGGDGRRRRRKSTRDDLETRGHAYRYDTSLDDENVPILDISPAVDEDSESIVAGTRRRLLSTDVGSNGKRNSRKKERSWEERQIAMERIPPIDIMAWGPSGALSMSAREKAFMDAQEDIETARRNLNLMKKKEFEAKEEITILKVDAERRRLRLSDSPPERRSRRDVEELRQIELEIDDASRNLRRCRMQVDRALDRLDEFEERHHAIMSSYNIDQASTLVGESLNQFTAAVQGKGSNVIASNTNSWDVVDSTNSGETNDAITDSAEN